MNSLNDFLNLDSTVTRVIVSSNCGNDASLVLMDMSRFIYLKELIIGDNCFSNVGEFVLNNSTLLEKIVIGSNSFGLGTGEFHLLNLPLLRELTVGSNSFTSYSSFVLDAIPLLSSVSIDEQCFVNVNELRLDGLSGLRSVVIGTNSFSSRNGDLYVKNCPLLRELKISSNAMSVFKLFEIESVPLLESLEIGDNCFSNVGIFSLNGLAGLLTVVIGVNSFTNQKNSYGQDTYRHFYLRNCPKVKSLRISRYSFSDYPYCVIESVPSLELIQIGELNLDSKNFYYSSLSLYRCASDHLITTRITQSEECGFWGFIVLPLLQYFLPEF